MPSFSPNPFAQAGMLTGNTALMARLQALEERVQVLEQALTIAHSAITLKSGSASLVLKPNGDVTIACKDFIVRASGNVEMKAYRDVVIKGSKVAQN